MARTQYKSELIIYKQSGGVFIIKSVAECALLSYYEAGENYQRNLVLKYSHRALRNAQYLPCDYSEVHWDQDHQRLILWRIARLQQTDLG